MITLALYEAEIPVGQGLIWGLTLLVFYGGIVAFFLQLHFEKRDIQSCLVRQRDEELDAVRAREQGPKQADSGDVGAQRSLGHMYEKGQGVPQDYAEAAKWYRLAAEQGDVETQFKLGVMYDKGWGVLQDSAEAAKWYRLAADQGDAEAQFSLGEMYANGHGVPQDYAEAAEWYRLAADQGLEKAAKRLEVLEKK